MSANQQIREASGAVSLFIDGPLPEVEMFSTLDFQGVGVWSVNLPDDGQAHCLRGAHSSAVLALGELRGHFERRLDEVRRWEEESVVSGRREIEAFFDGKIDALAEIIDALTRRIREATKPSMNDEADRSEPASERVDTEP